VANFAACGGDSESTSDPTPTSTRSIAPSPVPTRADQPVGERLVDVGGYRLAIRCQGQGTPTVIFENGGFPTEDVFGEELADDVAREWRVCTYDRAGTGKSEVGPNPRDARQISKELDQLLANAGETGPFVLVGWSIAGIYTPLYAIEHPDDVAGYVFIDPRLPSYQLEVGSDPLLTAYAGSLPAPYGEELRAWDQSATQVRDAGPLPVRPLVVLTAGAPESIADANTRQGGYDLWRSTHEDFATSVAGGQHIVVDNATHAIWQANPQAVLDAIRTVAEGDGG
jgi:pimeloyl-ACP methyl ester carboxylesterase